MSPCVWAQVPGTRLQKRDPAFLASLSLKWSESGSDLVDWGLTLRLGHEVSWAQCQMFRGLLRNANSPQLDMWKPRAWWQLNWVGPFSWQAWGPGGGSSGFSLFRATWWARYHLNTYHFERFLCYQIYAYCWIFSWIFKVSNSLEIRQSFPFHLKSGRWL